MSRCDGIDVFCVTSRVAENSFQYKTGTEESSEEMNGCQNVSQNSVIRMHVYFNPYNASESFTFVYSTISISYRLYLFLKYVSHN